MVGVPIRQIPVFLWQYDSRNNGEKWRSTAYCGVTLIFSSFPKGSICAQIWSEIISRTQWMSLMSYPKNDQLPSFEIFALWNSWSISTLAADLDRKYADASWHTVSCIQKYCYAQVVCLWKTCFSRFYHHHHPPQNTHTFQYQITKDGIIPFCLWYNSVS